MVQSISFEILSEKVYNFEVEGNHNYFVSEDGILSHNGRGAAWRAIFENPNTASRIRGWIQQELNRGRSFSRVRTPPGCDLGHHPTNRGPHDSTSRMETPRDNRRRPWITNNDPRYR